jgi:agmatinase
MIQHTMGDQTPVYLSLDVDCMDPAHAPGTGTPEIGGLTSMFVSTLLDELYAVNWQGMDLVEVAPAYDHSQITALAGATFVWQYLSMLIHKKIG